MFKRLNNILLIILILMIFWVTTSSAVASPWQIKVVDDKTGIEPVESEVYLFDKKDQKERKGKTDARGTFIIESGEGQQGERIVIIPKSQKYYPVPLECPLKLHQIRVTEIQYIEKVKDVSRNMR